MRLREGTAQKAQHRGARSHDVRLYASVDTVRPGRDGAEFFAAQIIVGQWYNEGTRRGRRLGAATLAIVRCGMGELHQRKRGLAIE